MDKDFADTFVGFARGEITKDEMNKAARRLSQDVVRNYESRKTTEDARKPPEVVKTAYSKR